MLILFLCCLARILNLFAEENAVEDTIYYLSESLRKEAIDLELFLKVTHQHMIIILNRNYFVMLTTAKKVLPCVSWVGDILVNHGRIATPILLTHLFNHMQYFHDLHVLHIACNTLNYNGTLLH